MSIESRISDAIERYRKMNPAPGQKAFNWEESAHPRDKKGEFSVKGSGESAKQPDDSEKKITDAAEDYKTNGIKAKAFKDWFGNWEDPGADCSKVVDAKGKPKKNSQVDGKGSKVMKDGKPVVVYHGTSNGQFDRFDKAKIGDGNLYGPGFYFTEDDDIADSYKAKDRLKHKLDLSKGQLATIGDFIENHLPNKYWKVERGEKTGSIFVLETDHSGKTVRATAIDCDPLAEDRTSLVREYLPSMTNWPQGVRDNWQKMLDSMGVPKPEIKQVYLNIRKPFDIDKGKVPVTGDMKADYEAFVSIFSEMLEHNPGDTHAAEELKTYKKRLKTGVNYDDALRMFETSPDKKRAMNEYLQSLGYDGITHVGGKIMGDRDHRVWIAFEGSQVKSVNNRGTFDLKDDRMDYSKRIQAAVDRYNKSASEPKKDHEFSSTQIDLPNELADKVRAMAEKIPDDEMAEDGREYHPHITTLFGLHTNDPDDVKEVLYGQRPVEIVMGETSLFENPDADVLKIDILGDGIHDLNKKLKKCEHTSTHPDYKPHCTIAYLKPGYGKKYTGLDTVNLLKFMADEVQFSDKQRKKTPIYLVSETKQISDRIVRAKELYEREWKEHLVTRGDDGTFKEWKKENEENDTVPHCPNCGSSNTCHARTTGNGNAVCYDCRKVFTDEDYGNGKYEAPLIVDYQMENYSKRINAVMERYGKKPASNQKSIFDEDLHPRSEDGTFTEKEESKSPASLEEASKMNLEDFAKSQGTSADHEPTQKAHAALQKRATVPGMQQNLFDTDTGGQKSLFDYVPPTKADSKKAKAKDLFEGVGERLKAALKGKETISPADLAHTVLQHEPLPGQKGLF